MRTISNLISSQRKLDVLFELENAMIDTERDFIELQKEQLFAGERSDGKNIFNIKTGSDEYSERYAQYKGKLRPIDLHDKGDFYQGIFADARDIGFFVDSSDIKSADLQRRYGEEIFGLGDDRLQEYIYQLSPVLIKNVENSLNATAL